MRTVSSTLRAVAAALGVRGLMTQIWMDPNRTGVVESLDVSPFFSDWSIDRQLTTDVPTASRLIVGYVSAEFTGNAIGQDQIGGKLLAGKKWSPYASTSFLFGKDPINTLIEVKAGIPAELIPRFTGYVRILSTKAATASVEALDRNSQLQNDTVIPMLANSYKDTTVTPQRGTRPGLNANTIMDFALRQNGIYMTPPPRAGCFLSVPAHGSLHPEPGFGTPLYSGTPNVTKSGVYEEPTGTVETHDGSMVSFDHVGAFAGGPFGDNGASGITPSLVPVCALSAPSDIVATYGPTSLLWSDVFATNKSVTVEGWVYVPATPPQGIPATSPIWGIRFVQDPRPSDATTYHLAAVGLLANGTPYASVGNSFTLAQGTASTVKGWTYFLARLTFGLTSTTVAWRVNDQALQTATIAAVPGIGFYGQAGGFYVNLCCNRNSTASTWQSGERTSFEALQCTTESAPPTNFGFTPNAFLDYSMNPLTVSPFSTTGRDTQTLLQDLTAAEFGLAYFDEVNSFYFFNRGRWGRAPGNTSQVTVTSENQLEDLTVTHNRDGIINDVEIAYTPYSIGAYQQVYNNQNLIGLHSGETKTIVQTLDNPTVALDCGGATSSKYDGQLSALGPGTVIRSGYRASFDPKGLGTNDPPTNLSVWVKQTDESTVAITIQNRENRPIYMVSGSDQASGSEGVNFVYLFGRPVTQAASDTSDTGSGDGTTVAKAADAISDDKYGTQPYDSPQNDWLQSQTAAQGVANTLLAQLKDAHPLIEDVVIKAHPGLQLGDRITLQDTAGTQLDTTASTIGTVIVGIDESWAMDRDTGGAGYAQSLTLRLMDMSVPIT